MLRRLRQFVKMLLLIATVLLVAAWWRSGTQADCLVLDPDSSGQLQATLFVYRGAVHFDYGGLRYLRDWRQRDVLKFSWLTHETPNENYQLTVNALPWHRFGWRREISYAVPLQGLTDSAGLPIMQSETVPLKLISMPVIVAMLLLGAWPAIAIVRRIGRQQWRAIVSPARFLRRRAIVLLGMAAIILCVFWAMSSRTMFAFAILPTVKGPVIHEMNLSKGEFTAQPYLHDWDSMYTGYRIFGLQRTSGTASIGTLELAINDHLVGQTIPCWLLVIGLAVPPLTWLLLRLTSRRRRVGHCPQCDYDLRHSRDRCPECGRPISDDPPHRAARWRVLSLGLVIAILLFAGLIIYATFPRGAGPRETSWQVFVFYRDGRGIDISAGPSRIELSRSMQNRADQPILAGPPWLLVAGLLAMAGGLFWIARPGRPSLFDTET